AYPCIHLVGAYGAVLERALQKTFRWLRVYRKAALPAVLAAPRFPALEMPLQAFEGGRERQPDGDEDEHAEVDVGGAQPLAGCRHHHAEARLADPQLADDHADEPGAGRQPQ